MNIIQAVSIPTWGPILSGGGRRASFERSVIETLVNRGGNRRRWWAPLTANSATPYVYPQVTIKQMHDMASSKVEIDSWDSAAMYSSLLQPAVHSGDAT